MITQIRAVTAVLLLAGSTCAQAAGYCGDLKTHYGPFDYRKRATLTEEIYLVERAHFTDDVANGIRGSTGVIGGDLAYTLHAFPNHHRALAAMARYALRTKSAHLPKAKYPVECYFNRAIRMAPDDGAVRAEYGNYLTSLGQTDRAFEMYRYAAELEPENATINYNLGLAYLKKNDYDHAAEFAHKAYSAGYPLPGLKKKLVEAGKWIEPRKIEPVADAPSDKPAG